MSSSLIPKNNSSYNDVNYWNKRYESDETYDWLVDYSQIRHIIEKHVSKQDSILMLGCGNSLLSEQMFSDGFENIHNIDYSESVISLMELHCDKCSQMKWSKMDCCQLLFENESFDVVIEKATIDAMLTQEKSQWNISNTNKIRVKSVLNEVSRVLKQLKGQFISISFFGPILRFPLYRSCSDSKSKLSINAFYELENNFHYYCYQLINSLEQNNINDNVYEPPNVTVSEDNCQSINDQLNHIDNNDINFIFNINI